MLILPLLQLHQVELFHRKIVAVQVEDILLGIEYIEYYHLFLQIYRENMEHMILIQ